MMRRLLVAAVLTLLPLMSAHADFEAGEAAYQRGDYATAYREFLPLARGGDVDAQFYLGTLYEGGMGGQPNYVEAIRWYTLAAEQGDAAAQVRLGGMAARAGRHAEAVDWFQEAANQGDADGQMNLGIAMASGMAGPVDKVTAYMWLTLAARQNAPRAAEARSRIARSMSRAEIAQGERQAQAWRPEGQ